MGRGKGEMEKLWRGGKEKVGKKERTKMKNEKYPRNK